MSVDVGYEYTKEEWKDHCIKMMKILKLPDFVQNAFKEDEKNLCFSASPYFRSTYLYCREDLQDIVNPIIENTTYLPFYIGEFRFGGKIAYMILCSSPFKSEWDKEIMKLEDNHIVNSILCANGESMECTCVVFPHEVDYGIYNENGITICA